MKSSKSKKRGFSRERGAALIESAIAFPLAGFLMIATLLGLNLLERALVIRHIATMTARAAMVQQPDIGCPHGGMAGNYMTCNIPTSQLRMGSSSDYLANWLSTMPVGVPQTLDQHDRDAINLGLGLAKQVLKGARTPSAGWNPNTNDITQGEKGNVLVLPVHHRFSKDNTPRDITNAAGAVVATVADQDEPVQIKVCTTVSWLGKWICYTASSPSPA